MKLLFALLLCVPLFASESKMYKEIHGDGIYTVADRWESDRKLRALDKEFKEGGLLRIAHRSEQALGAAFYIAVINLKRKGHIRLAEEVRSGWDDRKGLVVGMALNLGRGSGDRNLGDYAPLFDWLDSIYEKIENALGFEIAYALRLSDIKTLNYSIKYVFAFICENGLDEFNLHFVRDVKYRGLLPVVSYWITSLTCTIATFGAGYFFICSPISMLVERGVEKWLAPKISPTIYGWACDS